MSWVPSLLKPILGRSGNQVSSGRTYQPDYSRRGKVWVHGAFEPITGEATFVLSVRRDSTSHFQLLEKVIATFPADKLLLIEENLSTHVSRDTKIVLAAWPEIQLLLLPKYACWLNLIEPWWKQLRSLTLKGWRFESQMDLEETLWQALNFWNQHLYPYRWKKLPQQQLLPRGGFGFSRARDITIT